MPVLELLLDLTSFSSPLFNTRCNGSVNPEQDNVHYGHLLTSVPPFHVNINMFYSQTKLH